MACSGRGTPLSFDLRGFVRQGGDWCQVSQSGLASLVRCWGVRGDLNATPPRRSDNVTAHIVGF